jgi:hypothetical protein
MNNGMFSIRLVSLYFLLAVIFLFPPTGSAQVELRPDLQARPAFDLRIDNNLLRFSTTTWNNGAGPLELRAGQVNRGRKKQKVYQRIYLSNNSGFHDYLAGEFVWHRAHNHFHFENYARYSLQPVNAPGASERSGSKVTFCVMDNARIQTSLPGAPQSSVYATCGNQVQGMSVGWGDTYWYNLEGQSLDVSGLPAGDYKLVITVDPDPQNSGSGRLLELDEGNNRSCVLIHLDLSRADPAERVGVIPGSC